MQLCRPSLSTLQRRTATILGATLCLCSTLSGLLAKIHPNQFITAANLLLAVAGAAPIIATMVVLGNYLARETDEYVRTIVVRALLWGFGFVMIVDTILGSVFAFEAVSSMHLRVLGVLNMDVFLVTSGLALRIRMWRDQ